MRVRFEIENPHKLRPGLRSKMIFTRRGGIVGASEEADWPIQDLLGTLPDHLARIEALDERFVITAFPGSKVYLNGSSSPLRANRQVFLRADDKIRVGDLKLRIRESFIEDQEMDYMRLDDAVDVSSRVIKNDGYRGFVDAHVVADEDESVKVKSWVERNQWSNRMLVQNGSGDALFGLQGEWAAQSEDDSLARHFEAIEIGDDPHRDGPIAALATGSSPTQSQGAKERDMNASRKTNGANGRHADRYGFHDVENDEVIEAVVREVDSSDDIVAGNDILIALSSKMGIALSQLDDEDIPAAIEEMAESLRVSVEGLHAIYKEAQNGRKAGFAQFNRNAIDDNPLRFSQSSEEALRTMFLERSAVHLAPAAAMRESLSDLRQHQHATEAGIEEGLMAVMEAFRPSNLEKRFESYKRSEIPPEGEARDAWKWRLFETYFDELMNHRQASLNKFFWEVFNTAYQKDMRKEDNYMKKNSEEDQK